MQTKTMQTATSFLPLHMKLPVVRDEYFIQSLQERIFVREITPKKKLNRHITLFVHGLTFPSIPDFDLPIHGHSFVQYLAERGANCCIFDMTGYGKSSKPKNKQFTTDEKAEEVYTVYKNLIELRGYDSISVVGLSSGCNALIRALRKFPFIPQSITLLGACYHKNSFIEKNINRLNYLKIFYRLTGRTQLSYVNFSKPTLRKRLVEGEEEKLHIGSAAMFIEQAIEMSLPDKEKLSSPVMTFFMEQKKKSRIEPLFPVDHIVSPTLVVRGERDEICCAKSAVSLYKDLQQNNVAVKIYTHPDSRHDIHLYKNSVELFKKVHKFLIENREA